MVGGEDRRRFLAPKKGPGVKMRVRGLKGMRYAPLAKFQKPATPLDILVSNGISLACASQNLLKDWNRSNWCWERE
jgi:hypothetical protein